MDVGLDRLAHSPKLVARLRTSRLGLLAHPASVDRSLGHGSDVLERAGIRPSIFFGPEHGYGGEAQDMIGVESAVDARTGAPIVSLYGDAFEALSPRPDQLRGLDVLVVDLADIGSRYYTFVWTALLAVRAAARAGVHTLLLDRPNPLGGVQVEGATQLPDFTSFVGLEPVPIRHGLTPGEVVASFAARDGLSLGPAGALSVVGVRGWTRADHAPAWDRPFVVPSPNMPSWETALVYPGGCLLEGTNLSEGRGTTRPFCIVGAPWLDGRALAAALVATRLGGFVPRPLTFLPTFQKHARTMCGGVEIHVTDVAAFRPVATYVALVAIARALDPERFRFRTERYEFVDHIPALDLLLGSSLGRRAMEAGHAPRDIAEAASAVDPGWAASHADAIESARRARAIDDDGAPL